MNNRWIALLRGINVGGKNKIAMRDLVALFEASGCKDVETYIQSGNVVFTANATLGGKVAAATSKAIANQLGLEIPVVVRKASDWQKAVAANPFVERAADLEHLYMGALQSPPTAARIRALDPQRSPGDDFAVRGNHVYLHLPGGAARTKLTNAWFDSRLETVSTVRNWNTCLRLLAMAGGE